MTSSDESQEIIAGCYYSLSSGRGTKLMSTRFIDDYLNNTREFLSAARQFRNAIDEGEAARRVATDYLDLITTKQDNSVHALREFLLLSEAQEPEASGPPAVGESLATVFIELQVGTVLVASGAAVGEVSQVSGSLQSRTPLAIPPERTLDEAVAQLNKTERKIALNLANPTQVTFARTDTPPAALLDWSQLESAIAAFRHRRCDRRMM
jgi:hypothetical protein